MTGEKQRIKLAEWDEWTQIEDVSESLMMTYGFKVIGYPPNLPIIGAKVELPDYPNDLNEVHRLEGKLTEDERDMYGEFLNERLNIFEIITHHEGMTGLDGGFFEGLFFIAHATASQRCEALLKTLGLWEDEK